MCVIQQQQLLLLLLLWWSVGAQQRAVVVVPINRCCCDSSVVVVQAGCHFLEFSIIIIIIIIAVRTEQTIKIQLDPLHDNTATLLLLLMMQHLIIRIQWCIRITAGIAVAVRVVGMTNIATSVSVNISSSSYGRRSGGGHAMVRLWTVHAAALLHDVITVAAAAQKGGWRPMGVGM